VVGLPEVDWAIDPENEVVQVISQAPKGGAAGRELRLGTFTVEEQLWLAEA